MRKRTMLAYGALSAESALRGRRVLRHMSTVEERFESQASFSKVTSQTRLLLQGSVKGHRISPREYEVSRAKMDVKLQLLAMPEIW